MVFAAGLGTRMRPVTDHLPKPLVPIAGRTMLDHMLDRFAKAGVKRAIVNVHYLADQIDAHLATRTHPRIVISDERGKLLDQGGGIAKVLPLIGDDPFFICNTDAVWIEGPRDNLRGTGANVGSRAHGCIAARRRQRQQCWRRLAGRFPDGYRWRADKACRTRKRALCLCWRRHHQTLPVCA